jgi:DNA processing protein
MEKQMLQCLVGLSFIPGLGPVKYQKLLKHLGNPIKVWEASEEELRKTEGLGKKLVEDFLAARKALSLERELQRLQDFGVTAISHEEPQYPRQLLTIYDPPFLIYTKGISMDWGKPWVALVGSRNMTSYGREMAFWLGRELAARGIGVVSGLARGIDTWAHKGALKGGGETVAVLGSGLDKCYPPENRGLMQEIMAQGLLLSEFPLGIGPKPQHFPMRNRIISGISLGTVVVEAALKSGALITADLALEQGREVFALPGPITSPASRGCHNLIKQGAKLVQDVDDLLEELTLCAGAASPDRLQAATRVDDLSPEEEELLALIPYYPVPADNLVTELWPVKKVKAALTLLEIKGMIAQEAGNYFLRIK